MMMKRLFPSAILLLLAAQGCGKTSTVFLQDDPLDATARDVENGLTDLGTLDFGTPDFGTPDFGTPDFGMPDLGMPDTGLVPDAGDPECIRWDGGNDLRGEEGYTCTTRSRSCCEPDLRCFDLASPDSTDRFDRCLMTCRVDADCATSAMGGLCRSVSFNERACVSQEMAEGLPIELSASATRPITGCADGLWAIPGWLASLNELEDDQRSCGRPCGGTPNTCTPTYPYCNPALVPGTPNTGICTLRRALPGDICSLSSIVGSCDTEPDASGAAAAVFCLQVPNDPNGVVPSLLDPEDPSPQPVSGICTALCDPTPGTPGSYPISCSSTDDPGLLPASCKQIDPTDPEVGVCSAECSRFQDRCSRLGAFGLGARCSDPLLFYPNGEPFTQCRSVVAPVLPEFDFVVQPVVGCLQIPGGVNRCPANTFCINEGQQHGLCVRGCRPVADPDGCERSTVGGTTCDDSLIADPNDGIGLCRP